MPQNYWLGGFAIDASMSEKPQENPMTTPHSHEQPRVRELLHNLIEYADDSDCCQYGTLSSTLVRDIANEAVSTEVKPARAPWVCPWKICTHSQAQACRQVMRPRAGCGGRFPEGTTLEQAMQMIAPLKPVESKEQP